jgi:hypothetical protein
VSQEEIDILVKAAALWTPEMIRGVMLDILWFTPEEEKIIQAANAIAKKYGA